MIRQKTIGKLYSPRSIVTSTTTSTSLDSISIVDNILAPSAQVEDYRTSFIYIASNPSTGPVIGSFARVTDSDFSGTNSKLITAPAFTTPVLTGTTYEIHYKFHPNDVNSKINEILENIRGWVIVPLSGNIVNGNFNT